MFAQSWDVSNGFELEDQQIGIYSDLYDYIEILHDSSGSFSSLMEIPIMKKT
jgi:hypothetical protein